MQVKIFYNELDNFKITTITDSIMIEAIGHELVVLFKETHSGEVGEVTKYIPLAHIDEVRIYNR